jgi:hypothetical protein
VLVGTVLRVMVATLLSNPGITAPAGDIVPETGVLERSFKDATLGSGVCTAMKYGMPELGSVQKFGETCSDELRLTLRLVAIVLALRPSCSARARSMVA